jgi:hypothetical protein
VEDAVLVRLGRANLVTELEAGIFRAVHFEVDAIRHRGDSVDGAGNRRNGAGTALTRNPLSRLGRHRLERRKLDSAGFAEEVINRKTKARRHERENHELEWIDPVAFNGFRGGFRRTHTGSVSARRRGTLNQFTSVSFLTIRAISDMSQQVKTSSWTH